MTSYLKCSTSCLFITTCFYDSCNRIGHAFILHTLFIYISIIIIIAYVITMSLSPPNIWSGLCMRVVLFIFKRLLVPHEVTWRSHRDHPRSQISLNSEDLELRSYRQQRGAVLKSRRSGVETHTPRGAL